VLKPLAAVDNARAPNGSFDRSKRSAGNLLVALADDDRRRMTTGFAREGIGAPGTWLGPRSA
jgi:hypothetical protein